MSASVGTPRLSSAGGSSNASSGPTKSELIEAAKSNAAQMLSIYVERDLPIPWITGMSDHRIDRVASACTYGEWGDAGNAWVLAYTKAFGNTKVDYSSASQHALSKIRELDKADKAAAVAHVIVPSVAR